VRKPELPAAIFWYDRSLSSARRLRRKLDALRQAASPLDEAPDGFDEK